MKETQGHKSDQTKIHAQAEIEKKRLFKESMKRKPGLTLFKYDIEKEVLTVAVIKETVFYPMNYNGEATVKREVEVLSENEAFFYSLNRKNAIRKLTKLGLKIKEDER